MFHLRRGFLVAGDTRNATLRPFSRTSATGTLAHVTGVSLQSFNTSAVPSRRTRFRQRLRLYSGLLAGPLLKESRMRCPSLMGSQSLFAGRQTHAFKPLRSYTLGSHVLAGACRPGL